MPLASYHIDDTTIITSEQAWFYKIIPHSALSDDIKLCFYAASNTFQSELTFLFEKDIEFEIIEESEIKKLLLHYYPEKAEKNNTYAIEKMGNADDNLTALIFAAKKEQASDIHIEIYDNITRIRFRIDGQLIERYNINKDNYPALINKIKIQANLDISEKRLPQDGRILFEKNGEKFDIRVSVLPTLNGEKVVLRLLAKDAKFLDIKQLGFRDEELSDYRTGVQKPHGIILISGPTGSGKTTTLYATLKELNNASKNILTIEDPIEYTLQGINQVQVKENIGFGFASALRTFLRQDPDIIMLGEIRDNETAKMAIRASLTGHLVLSTIHTNSAIGTISRLIDMEIEPYLIADTLNLSMAQRLLRLLCDRCKEEVVFDPKAVNYKDEKLAEIETHYIAKGCNHCYQTGYKGRQAIYEALLINEPIAELIKTNQLQAIQPNIKYTLKDNAMALFKSGLTTFEEIFPILISN
jgi:type IV pilus assembly protein PilB